MTYLDHGPDLDRLIQVLQLHVVNLIDIYESVK